jgi:endonuclease YncB( thermonuclease family)
MRALLIVGFAVALAPLAAQGHGGGLDQYGCHHNRKTGDYHCHRATGVLPPRGSEREALAPRDSTVRAEMLTGRVVAITDGDTIRLLDASNTQHKIRLSGIDAPEKGQAFGNASRQHLSGLAFGKQAEADCYKIDRHKRLICTVHVNGQDVGLAQLDAGLAWWYRKYADEQPPRERVAYEAAEDRAAADRVGLWRDANPVPPWEWRKR